ncbi:DUF1294 domain-containing protein [Massilia sp. DD77]|uniref:DUF1294 domain-containing protein n=1 Tax=Massilia sp. DD77 TaxID=3109349 RepID=UPI002FFD6958
MPYLPLILFAGLYLFATAAWALPPLVGAAYLVTSLTCFVAYALDKSAARAKAWRTPEFTLLALGLAGGWPGGLLAQQWLRHKTAKASFQWKFQLTVALNLALFVWLSRQFGSSPV